MFSSSLVGYFFFFLPILKSRPKTAVFNLKFSILFDWSSYKIRLKLSQKKIQMKSICMKTSYQIQEELMIFWITITCPLLTIKTKAEQEMLHISRRKIVSLTRSDYKGTIDFPKLLTILLHLILLMNKISLWRLFNINFYPLNLF